MYPQWLQGIMYTGGRTNIADALKMAREELFVESRGDRQDAPNFLILFTDGVANERTEFTIPEAVATRTAGIHIIVVGVGLDLDIIQMENIASYPASENVKTIDSFTKMADLAGVVETATCNCEYLKLYVFIDWAYEILSRGSEFKVVGIHRLDI